MNICSELWQEGYWRYIQWAYEHENPRKVTRYIINKKNIICEPLKLQAIMKIKLNENQQTDRHRIYYGLPTPRVYITAKPGEMVNVLKPASQFILHFKHLWTNPNI